MIRRLFSFAAVLSLFLCAATVAVWVRSFRIVDEVDTRDVNLSLGNGNAALDWEKFRWRGRVRVSHYSANYQEAMNGLAPSPLFTIVYARSPGFHGFYADTYVAPIFGLSAVFGPSTGSDDFGTVVAHRMVFPQWFVALLFAILPAVWMAMRVLSACRGPRDGVCASCGYDLRASKDRCPECGSVIGSRKTNRLAGDWV